MQPIQLPVATTRRRSRPSGAWFFRWMLLTLLAAAALVLARPAAAQQPPSADIDPPGRVARLNLAEGALSFAPAGSQQWGAAPYNRPLTSGDRLWTAERARAEIDIGNALLRLDGETSLSFSEVDDDMVQLQLTQGALAVRLQSLYDDDRFEVDTPNLALVASRAGDYRIDVDAARGETRVAVRSGTLRLYGERGESVELQSGQQLTFAGRRLDPVGGALQAGPDAFDHWVATRNRALEQSTAARHVSPGTVGYQQLDQYGDWQASGEYGSVWYPSDVPAGWAPYRYGQWSYVAPWGWTWVDDAPWGFAPFHYGRWVQSGSRWGWVPGPRVPRASYAPALVAFSGAGGNVHWRPGGGVGAGAGASWFPLAPGEPWQPGYHASQHYIDRVNRGIHGWDGRRPGPDRFVYAGRPGAITSVEGGGWDGRRPVRVPVPGAGFGSPPQAAFAAPPPTELGRPWGTRDVAPQGPLRVPDDRRRGPRPDRYAVPAPDLPPPIRNARPMPKPQEVPILDAQPLPRPQQPLSPAQNRVAQDWQLYQQQQAQQQPDRRLPQDFQRGPDPARFAEQQRMQEQQRALRLQQEQNAQQQQRQQGEQMRRQQALQQQQFQQQQFQQQQQQQQRFQAEQLQRQQQQQQQMRDQMQQQQQRVLRDHQLFERQQQMQQQQPQMRGPAPG